MQYEFNTKIMSNEVLANVSKSENGKIEGKKYHYMHSGDCFIYVTYCENCKIEVGGWTPQEADKKWSEHVC